MLLFCLLSAVFLCVFEASREKFCGTAAFIPAVSIRSPQDFYPSTFSVEDDDPDKVEFFRANTFD